MAAFWTKIQFWKKNKTPKYRFQNAPMDDATWVEITSGEFAGVVFSFGMVKFSQEIGLPKLDFSYTILYSANHIKEELERNDNFITVMGDILTDIIIKEEPV